MIIIRYITHFRFIGAIPKLIPPGQERLMPFIWKTFKTTGATIRRVIFMPMAHPALITVIPLAVIPAAAVVWAR